MLDKAPLLDDASIRDFQGRKAGYVADAMEQALLLLGDMVELRSMRRHEVFLSLKRYLAMVWFYLTFFIFFFFFVLYLTYYYFFIQPTFLLWQAVQASFRVEEMTNSCHQQKKEEEGRHIATTEAFNVAEKSMQELKKKLQEKEKERKYTTTALENVEKQAKSQRLQLRGVEDQLATSKTQITALQKKLEEVKKAKEKAEKAMDEAEQHRYEVGVAETEDSLRAEVLAICRTYCALTWGEALNQAGVEASSVLKRAENIYYPQPYALLALQTLRPTQCPRGQVKLKATHSRLLL